MSQELNFRGNDDISRLGKALGKSALNIKFLICEIANISENVNILSSELLASTKESFSSIDTIITLSLTTSCYLKQVSIIKLMQC